MEGKSGPGRPSEAERAPPSCRGRPSTVRTRARVRAYFFPSVFIASPSIFLSPI
jgi:hypothetical protein